MYISALKQKLKTLSRIFVGVCSLLLILTATPVYSWESTTHFGYAVVDQSSTGLAKAAGTSVTMDLAKSFKSSFSLGLRTSALGGSVNQHRYYRLGAGPVLGYRINSKWAVAISMGFFRESAEHNSDDIYSSKGQAVQFGWHRTSALSKRVDLLWGGFIGRYWGQVDKNPDLAAVANIDDQNIGSIHGIEIALRVLL